jgi:hypothetical protein
LLIPVKPFFPALIHMYREKKRTGDAGERLRTPSRIFPHLAPTHSTLGFGFLQALFYGPPDDTQPDKSFQAGAGGCVTDARE